MELVLLHPLPFDASVWRRQESLTSHRLHAPTLYDLGDRLEDWADAVLVGATGERLIVVGNSVGGSCALEMAAQAPDRIAAVVLVGAKAGHDPDPQLRKEALEMLRQSELAAVWRRYWEPLLAPSTASGIRDEALRILGGLTAEQIARGVNVFHTRKPRDHVLADLKCPLICVTGDHDCAPGSATMASQAAAARNGRFVVVPDCGHYVPLERPEAMNTIIQQVISELS